MKRAKIGPLVLASVDARGPIYADARGALWRVGTVPRIGDAPEAITADSKPRYDEFGPDTHWGCAEWIAWHRAMLAKLGGAEADRRWVSAWLDGLSEAAGGRGVAPGSGKIFDSVPVDCRTTNDEFRAYVTVRRPLYDAVYHGIAGAVTAPLGAATDVSKSASHFVATNPGLTVGAIAIGALGFWLLSTGELARLARR